MATLSCSINNIDRTEDEIIRNEHLFTFDPTSALVSIEHGEENIFTSVDEEPEWQTTPQSGPVTWKQLDYFNIAEELHKKVWGESLENWSLFEMFFISGCDQTDLGFQSGQFKFFQIRNVQNQEIREVHTIEIDASRSFARVMDVEYSPNLEKWKTIDLGMIKVSADDALTIAEKNGGYEKRIAVENACGISVGTSKDYTSNDWLVIYFPSVFTDSIDLITGK